MSKIAFIPVLMLVLLTLTTGCVRRQITVDSEPRGAMVYLNDEEVGRTPVTVDFTWYGVYDVRVEKDGYETVQTTLDTEMPWWEIPPVDLMAEAAPWNVEASYRAKFKLKILDLSDTDIDQLIQRGKDLGRELESEEERNARIDSEMALINKKNAETQSSTQPETPSSETQPETTPSTAPSE